MRIHARMAAAAAMAAIGSLAVPAVAVALPPRAGAVQHPAGAPRSRPAGSGVRASAYADRGVIPFGDAQFDGSPTDVAGLSAPVVGMAATPTGNGYWLVAADGGIFNYGDAGFYGSAGNVNINAPVVGIAATPSGHGYWSVAIDGGVFQDGDAGFYGSTGNVALNQPIVGMTPTPDGKGYWLVASDGGIFDFGDAKFFGSTGNVHLNSPIVGMAATPDGGGYWLVAADGGIFDFGDAGFYGSAGDRSLPASVAGMIPTTDGKGYLLAGSDGSIYPFGDAVSYGDNTAATPTQPIAGIAASAGGKGYYLLEPDAFPTAFSHPGGGGAIVAAAASQIEGNPDQSEGLFCNPYGPCEAWCALFATWAWEAGGVPIPREAFTGAVWDWAVANTYVYDAATKAVPGDAVLYGTGPQNADTSVHMGIVAQVWPDGAVVTIEGDSGPGAYGQYNVTINGPFLPTDSDVYNGMGIYAIAHQ
ncbi:DUF4988 domain-containing protein [Acidiferrimicrobium sp. IK]|uniref:DUF4988 domain-containing protein n=1 Tax=Acidiferrimicrobium sp. IK TaxID=2871700 RepID=UPI0021CB38CE|nr:DUF4988 domain-containing protein [Acidiferrimicrobium sp. IK]MCU4185665.1 DUF4988 domain-containing protein [Acidiferrimicrobium sp. IK]